MTCSHFSYLQSSAYLHITFMQYKRRLCHPGDQSESAAESGASPVSKKKDRAEHWNEEDELEEYLRRNAIHPAATQSGASGCESGGDVYAID